MGKKFTVTKEWIGDLGDLFFDLEHSQDEPVNRAIGQKSKDEILMEIKEMFDKINVEILEQE